MKLEDKFFKSFFYPFLLAIFLSTLAVTIFLYISTSNNFDKKSSQNIINLEKRKAKMNLNAVNILITTMLIKIQAGLNELISFYLKIANDLLENEESHKLKTEHFLDAVNIDFYFCDNNSDIVNFTGSWFIDDKITYENLGSNKEAEKQVTAVSNIISNIDAVLEVSKPRALAYFFFFEKTELYASYPLSIDCKYDNFAYEMAHYPYYEFTYCVDDRGEYYKVYKVKCQGFYLNMMKAKTDAFDINSKNQKKTILINNFYFTVLENASQEFTMCIEFYDPISRGKGYACVDVDYNDLILPLNTFNSKIKGYYLISNVGFNNVFYFPQSTSAGKIPIEYIFNWRENYKLDEKNIFFYEIKKFFSSNYIDKIGNSIYDEVYINGKNSSQQFFYLNEQKFNYSIYPIILENLNGEKEHVFSIIYIYNTEIYFDGLEKYNSSLVLKIILELVIFIIFGSGLLYIIFLTFNILSKYIVIPTKNVNYMLKGINIGGENRLNYLNFLKKKQDENIEKLEKNYSYENNKNSKEIQIVENTYNYEIQSNDGDNILNEESTEKLSSENINSYDDFNKKYDEETNYIENEYNFYDFDDQLLQYRSLEMERLIKSLIDLKDALILTSQDREVEEIINYSHTEEIFKNFKNKKGAIICESNIGNLQGQLLKFDKAIYHLALSIQDNKLKRFINRNINDELDEQDSLLKKISNFLGKENMKEKNNILADKQKNSSKDNFSQKNIGILINTRYCRLIRAYYMFFKNLQKLQKSKEDSINGQFMNTLFHTIDYYQKILIQYIFLSYIKNDLVKIGESILDYLEFLMKFKFKTLSDEKYFLKIYYRNRPEYKEKQEFKKKIFNKIINWFNLFDDYITYVKDYSSLNDLKGILEEYSKNLNSENNELDMENEGTLLFRISNQRYDFLKAKFALYCKNYNDALFYFIRAAKGKKLFIDGLIKKRSLKHIYKLLLKMKKKFGKFSLRNLYKEKEIKEYKKSKNKIYIKKNHPSRKVTNRSEKIQIINSVTFGEEIEIIKNAILQDIRDCNAKEEKDIIILIDFNIYNHKGEENSLNKTYKIDVFIEQTKEILNNYLSVNDRLCVFIYFDEYKIICPLMAVNKIDTNSFSKDLIYYKNKTFNTFNVNIETEDFDINFNFVKEEDNEFNLEGNNISEHSIEESLELSEKEKINFNKLNGLVKAINYLNNYSKIKGSVKNEKYIILFSDMMNMHFFDVEKIEKILDNITGDEDAIFLLVGKNKKFNIKNEKNSFCEFDHKLEELILNKFGDKSELINFENMKKIKSILSNNNVIKDEIIYPNEIYK